MLAQARLCDDREGDDREGDDEWTVGKVFPSLTSYLFIICSLDSW